TLSGRSPLKGDQELLGPDTNGFPSYGAVVSRLTSATRSIPTHVALPHVMYNVVELPGQTAGFLGAAYNPFQVRRDPNAADFQVGELELPADLSLTRMSDRRALLSLLDPQLRRKERQANAGSMTVYQERALDLLRSEAVRQAFDLSREAAMLR